MNSPRDNPWTATESHEIYENAWITVREDQVIRPDGQPGIYGIVHFKNRAVGVVPVEDDGSVWLVGQHRYPLGSYSWEIPEGGCPPHELPEACALRELEEETGLVADHLEPIAQAHLSNSVSDEYAIIYRGTRLTHGPSRPEGTERLQVRRVPFEQALAMVERGEITDSMSVIGLLKEALDRARHAKAVTHQHAIRFFRERMAIVRLSADAPVPDWVGGQFHSVTRTPDELSIVVEASRVPAAIAAERGWRMLRVEGALPLGQTGILAGLATTLADAGVPIFSLSTFDTDYFLVRDSDCPTATTALEQAGHAVASGER